MADHDSGKAIIIDAAIENVERDLVTIKELGLTLVFAVETHFHADHITGASLVKDCTGVQMIYGGKEGSQSWSHGLTLQSGGNFL